MKEFIIPPHFDVGSFYTNDQITYALEVGNSGGIRPKLNSQNDLDFVVLITSNEAKKNSLRNPYADRIEGDILTYTGAGLKGEQAISGVNRRILEQLTAPIPILGFEKIEVNKYKFLGLLFLLRYYEDFQLDTDGSLRKVIIFEFRIISGIGTLIIGNFSQSFIPFYTQLRAVIQDDDRIIDNELIDFPGSEDIDKLKNIERLKADLLTINPYEFEIVISKLVSHIGFTDVHVTKKSSDDGVDVYAMLKNPISVDLKYLFQVKRWKHSVGRNEVANLRGSMGLNNQGVIVSTSHFTSSAIHEATAEQKTPISLVGISDLYSIINNSEFNVDDFIPYQVGQ